MVSFHLQYDRLLSRRLFSATPPGCVCYASEDWSHTHTPAENEDEQLQQNCEWTVCAKANLVETLDRTFHRICLPYAHEMAPTSDEPDWYAGNTWAQEWKAKAVAHIAKVRVAIGVVDTIFSRWSDAPNAPPLLDENVPTNPGRGYMRRLAMWEGLPEDKFIFIPQYDEDDEHEAVDEMYCLYGFNG